MLTNLSNEYETYWANPICLYCLHYMNRAANMVARDNEFVVI